MKKEAQARARALRKKGISINDIAGTLGVSKGSVSLWVRDIKLTKEQRAQNTARGFSRDAIEKRRIARITKTKKRHSAVFLDAQKEVSALTKKELWLLGVALYWGEGTKTFKGNVSITNSDPAIIKIMMRFFREILNIPDHRFRCHVHTFAHKNAKLAEAYWSGVTRVPVGQFYKTYTKPSSASRQKRETLPYGTVGIYICDTALQLKMLGWIEGLKPRDMCHVPAHLL